MGDAPKKETQVVQLGRFEERPCNFSTRAFSAKGSKFAGVGPATSFMLIAFHSPACLISATSLYLYGTVCWNTRIVPVLHSSLENGDNLKRLIWILLHYCRARCTIVTTKRYAIMPKSAKYAWPATKNAGFFFFSEDSNNNSRQKPAPRENWASHHSPSHQFGSPQCYVLSMPPIRSPFWGGWNRYLCRLGNRIAAKRQRQIG